jgi:hypothetical protein
MSAITPIKVAEYRDERLEIVSNGAVIRELSYFSSIINHSRREWGINMVNPIPLVKKSANPQGRSRTLSNDELERLFKACKPRVKNGNIWALPVGKSTGPNNKEGKDRIRAAHLKHGEETLEAKAERNAKSVMFRYLTDIGNHCDLFYKQLKTRGRPPSGYKQLDLSDPEQLALAILKIVQTKL